MENSYIGIASYISAFGFHTEIALLSSARRLRFSSLEGDRHLVVADKHVPPQLTGHSAQLAAQLKLQRPQSCYRPASKDLYTSFIYHNPGDARTEKHNFRGPVLGFIEGTFYN